ncbi:MAG TPA: hypothetical protein VFI25_04200 [Planctomycetota bacterium]|jgi:hypothetical protein|nr:hypothetical protein [Planctomycetota bacterium]
MRKILRAPLLLLAPSVLVCASRAQGFCGGLTVTISPNPAPYGAPVTVTATNNTGATESLTSSCVFNAILQGSPPGTPVLSLICLTVLTPIPPNGQLAQTWDQKGNCGEQVAPGPYAASVSTVSGGNCLIPFTVSPCPAGGASSFGSGCGTGAACPSPPTLTLDDCALIGTSVTLRLANGSSALPAAVALGTSNASWMGIPLPLSIGGGCSILISPDLFLPATAANPQGLALFSVPIPADPSLVGQVVYAQGGTTTASGAVRTTNGLAVTIG